MGNEEHMSAEERSLSFQQVKSNTAKAIVAVMPYLIKLEALVAKILLNAHPYIVRMFKLYKDLHQKLDPYGADEIIGVFTGLGMMFYGGKFITPIAIVEALNQSGREALVRNISELSRQAAAVKQANIEDDREDVDGNGVADVNEISKSELARRKLMLIIRSVDPNVVSAAVRNLYGILMAVTATLKVRFARAISLGTGLGHVLSQTILKYLIPPLKEVIHPDFHPWIVPVVQYTCNLFGVSVALSIQRVISIFHTAIRGARLVTDSLTKWAQDRNLEHLLHNIGHFDDVFAIILAAAGVHRQLISRT